MSRNPNVVLFGAFSEEETQKIQKEFALDKRSEEKTYLQFGSLHFNSAISSQALKSESKKPDLSLASESSHALVFNAKKNGNSKQTIGTQKPLSIHSNGNSDNCSLISKNHPENGKVTEVLNPASAVTEGLRKTEDSSGKNLTDVTSPTTKESLENEAHLDKEELQKLNYQKILNGDEVAVNPLLPRGLINSGNLCFLNAILQALLSCSPFVGLLQHLRERDIPKTGFQTLHAFVEFISDFDMPHHPSLRKNDPSVIETGKSFIPISFEAVLKKFTPDLANNISGRPRQEDAQEFLSFIMHQMHDELLKLDGHFTNSNGHASSMISSAEDDGWETVGPKNKSAVTRTQSFIPSELSNIFGGQLRSVVKARGNKASATVQPFLLLHLDISPSAVCTIEDALHRFSIPETLEGYKAAAGKSASVSASKSIKIQTVSKILILHLMRFSYGSKGIAKIHKPVRFYPELVLNRDLLVSPTSEGRRYELVATVTHHGRDPSKGHYTSDARYSNGKWLRYDDASVTSVSTTAVLHDQAYVLFYKQKK